MIAPSTILTYRRTELRELALDQLQRGTYQPRQTFSPEGLAALTQTIRQLGILEPLVVRALPTHKERFEIVAGERRWRAAQQVGLATAPCLIGHYTDEEAAQIALVENTHREALDPLSHAQALQRLLSEFHYTHDELAAILGVSREQVSHQVRLLKLDARLQVWLKTGDLLEGHGKLLAGVPIEQQYRLGYLAVQQHWSNRTLTTAIHALKQPASGPKKSALLVDARLTRVAQRLSNQLGYKTKVQLNPNQGGHVRIEFADRAHLQSLLIKLGYEED